MVGLGAIGAIFLALSKNSLNGEISKMAQTLESKGIAPETFLKRQDKSLTPPRPETEYAKLIDELDAKCTQTRSEVAVMSFVLVDKQKKAGLNTSQIEGLDQFLGEVSMKHRKRSIDCLEPYLQLSKYIKKQTAM